MTKFMLRDMICAAVIARNPDPMTWICALRPLAVELGLREERIGWLVSSLDVAAAAVVAEALAQSRTLEDIAHAVGKVWP